MACFLFFLFFFFFFLFFFFFIPFPLFLIFIIIIIIIGIIMHSFLLYGDCKSCSLMHVPLPLPLPLPPAPRGTDYDGTTIRPFCLFWAVDLARVFPEQRQKTVGRCRWFCFSFFFFFFFTRGNSNRHIP